LQEVIAAARAAAAAGRVADARTGYERALRATPDSPFLHRELAIVERRAGNAEAALGHFRRAVELDANDMTSLVQTAELLEERGEFAAAEAAYRKAAAVEPGAELTAKIARAAERARDAGLPEQFRAIAASQELTRGDLAALIGVRLEAVLRTATPRPVVATDVRGHWAAPWINEVARAGVMDPFENHTFQPRARLRRVDLAAAVSRVLALIAPTRPALRTTMSDRPTIADMPATHLSYPAVADAVTSGVLPLLDGNRFQVGRAVTGAEAIDAVNRLRTLATP
jgi:hypothetical protein